ncbi:hypothetical protein [Marinospirillum insulare]|uniref:Uncharacterized protein n=1 Tax=Marinospirillum insulare TaxID=217169 RepID=A0ABQ5ZRF5_9GAMM|nr:hypothetical protein [Marinospirillum insulare]GLR62721.1 hypothetical protein GCM10007878_01560 [Marinospirillum insulare]
MRGKYCDVILPMVVLRRFRYLARAQQTSRTIDEIKFQKEEMNAIELNDAPLKEASGYS